MEPLDCQIGHLVPARWSGITRLQADTRFSSDPAAPAIQEAPDKCGPRQLGSFCLTEGGASHFPLFHPPSPTQMSFFHGLHGGDWGCHTSLCKECTNWGWYSSTAWRQVWGFQSWPLHPFPPFPVLSPLIFFHFHFQPLITFFIFCHYTHFSLNCGGGTSHRFPTFSLLQVAGPASHSSHPSFDTYNTTSFNIYSSVSLSLSSVWAKVEKYWMKDPILESSHSKFIPHSFTLVKIVQGLSMTQMVPFPSLSQGLKGPQTLLAHPRHGYPYLKLELTARHCAFGAHAIAFNCHKTPDPGPWQCYTVRALMFTFTGMRSLSTHWD